MKGYFKDEEKTKEVLTEDGWFKTGDIGKITEDGFLFITDRKKELFKTSGGKYVAPQVIENKFKESDFIEQIMVVGEGEKYISAIVVPNFTYLHNWCSYKKINFSNHEKLIKKQEIIDRYAEEIEKFNEFFGQVEKIKKFRLTATEWTPENGYLSPTLKLKRRLLLKEYKKTIEEIYKE